MKKNILIIGVRKKCYKAAINLGHNVFLWSDGKLNESRKKNLAGWIEAPYLESINGLADEVEEFVKENKISVVIANSEDTVILGARVRKFLGLKTLGFNLVERFHNKFVMKNSAREAQIPMTKYKLIEEDSTAEDLIKYLGLPLVIKPVDESGAQDVKVAYDKDEVVKFMEKGLLAEAFVKGTEVSVETFVQNGEPIFHNFTEYLHQWKKSVVPAEINDDLKKQITDLNDKVIKHFKLDRGMTHAEFYLTDKGPLFGEIAVRPPGGYYMELIEKVYGFNSWEAYVKLSCGEDIDLKNKEPIGNAAVLMFHPGAGKVTSITGEEKVKKHLDEILEFRIRRSPGDLIDAHTNTSNEVGHILFWEKSRNSIMNGINFVEENFTINTTGL